MRPTVGRIAAAGLATASITITVVAVFLLREIAQEAEVAQVIEGHQHVRQHLESIKDLLRQAHFSAFAFTSSGERGYAKDLERERVEIGALVENLRGKAANHPNLSANLTAIEPPVREYLDQATLVLRAPAGTAPLVAAEESQARSLAAVKSAIDRVDRQLREQAADQAERASRRETAAVGLLAGSLVVLVGLAIAFRQSQLRARADRRRIEQLAHYDALTGLPNRSLLGDRLEQAIALSARNASPLAVLLFDLDGFKGVNDAFGHAAGDALLVATAQRIRDCMRASDTVGRLGGDEFLAILPETDRTGAQAVAEKLLAALASPFDLGGARASVSASIGGGFLPGPAGTAEALVHAADVALYTAKREGKNRYFAQPEDGGDGRAPAQGAGAAPA